MTTKLETLGENLILKENDKKKEFIKDHNFDPYKHFHNMKRRFNKEEMKLINKKDIYPYEFVDDPSKLDYVGLPPKKSFLFKIENGRSKR